VWPEFQTGEGRADFALCHPPSKPAVFGLVFEQMGDTAKSVACMKQVYEADYGYKDVATRVERSYRPESQPS
jgi:predicted type IV restriction endonuclease